jgi:predicted dehydrogenase
MAVKVGVLGFAHGHVNSYLDKWKALPEMGVDAVAGWDHDARRLKEAAAKFGIKPCASPESLLADPSVQAVVIAAETSMHADLVELAAAAGKAVVVQKPLALTMAQGGRITAAVNKYGVPFTVAWQMRVDQQNNIMKDMIKNETLGKVLTVRRRHGLTTHLGDWFVNAWHNVPEYNRDIWADDSAHPIDWINDLFGAPESVTAELVTLANDKIPNNNGIAIFRYPGGPLVEVCCSFTCVAAVCDTEIVCERGVIIHNFGDAPSCNNKPKDETGLKWYSEPEKKWIYSDTPSPGGHGERIAALSAPLADFLNGKRGPVCTAEDALLSLRMVLATYVSSASGRRVKLDDPAVDRV